MNSKVCMSTPICDLLSVLVCSIFYSISLCSTSLSHIISLHVLRSLPFSFRNREDAENCSDKANPTEQKVETRGLHCGILETDHILADKKREQPVREGGHWRHGGLSFSAGTNSILVNGLDVQFFCSNSLPGKEFNIHCPSQWSKTERKCYNENHEANQGEPS